MTWWTFGMAVQREQHRKSQNRGRITARRATRSMPGWGTYVLAYGNYLRERECHGRALIILVRYSGRGALGSGRTGWARTTDLSIISRVL